MGKFEFGDLVLIDINLKKNDGQYGPSIHMM